MKYSKDDGATWRPLEYTGIAQMLPRARRTRTTLLDEGYGKPATRRLPYNDFGVVFYQDVTAGPADGEHSLDGANRLGFDVGEFVHINLGKADEEYVQVLADDPEKQTFTAVFAKDHAVA